MIPKPGKSEKRPLGIGSPREKIIQKGLQIILEAIYEPKFLNCSHGFRPNRSTHSALYPLYLTGHHFTWVIQGDISKCFDRIPHNVIISLLKKEIKCDKFLTLLHKSLVVGYLDPDTKQIVKSQVGTPQGSVLSPLLANIVLHELDNYTMNQIIPEFTKGKRRKTNPEYNSLIKLRYIRGTQQVPDVQTRKIALDKMRSIPRMDPYDPNYRRAKYIRYADDFIFLLEGTKSEAILIREQIKSYLKEKCGLDLNIEKTIITNLTEGFNFLGTEIKKCKTSDFRMKTKTKFGKKITMRPNLRLRLNLPLAKLLNKLIETGFAKRNHQGDILAKARTDLIHLDHASIIQYFNSKINGLVTYYSYTANRIKTWNLIWLLRSSAAKTLSRKFKLRSSRQAFKKFGPWLKDPSTHLEIRKPGSLRTIHQYNNSKVYESPISTLAHSWYSRLTKSNLFQRCVLCYSASDIQMHHLRSVKDVRAKMRSGIYNFKA